LYGKNSFIEGHQDAWLAKLAKEPQSQLMVRQLFEQLKCVEKNIQTIRKKIKERAKTYTEIKLFRDLPGIDWIHAATFSALIENPYRFATKRIVGICRNRRCQKAIIYCSL